MKDKLPYLPVTIEIAVREALEGKTVQGQFYLWGNGCGDNVDRLLSIINRIQEVAYEKGVHDTQQAMKTALGIK